ncbi:MAG: hypothetical protein LBV43_08665 [Prevotella sp.]|jgi:hypothetical protein|nr:hypothetical protein [Prevotella sp.]
MKISTLRNTVCLVIAFICISSTMSVRAQSELEIGLGADVVSSYVWRGLKQAGASIQPGLSASISGFSLAAWGSTDIAGNGSKEVDFTASYEVDGLKLAVTDYWWDGEGAERYFSSPYEGFNGHYLETTLGYTLPEVFPLSIAWNTFVLGKGNKKEDGKNSYSTFIELAYPFSVKGVDMFVSTGFTPWQSEVYGTDGFEFTSIALNASKEIKITDSYSLPVFANIICNPNREDIHFVFGFSIK